MIEMCDDCDLYDYDDINEGWYCTKAQRVIDRFNPVPDWCPLEEKE